MSFLCECFVGFAAGETVLAMSLFDGIMEPQTKEIFMNRIRLSGNGLKLLAALFMIIDHMGLMLFPSRRIFRILGRLAMPIYAYMIAEGCKYTRNKKKYFGMVFGLAALCQTVYYFFDGSTYFSILCTFSLSILTIYALQLCKERKDLASGLLFCGAVAVVFWLNRVLEIDYGFWGCMLPVFAALPHGTSLDSRYVSVACLALGLVLLSQAMGGLQVWSLLAVLLLLLYDGSRGKWNLKYFFYIFYPVHLVVLQGIVMLLELL